MENNYINDALLAKISKEQNGNDLVYTINVNADSEDDGKISIDTKIEYKEFDLKPYTNVPDKNLYKTIKYFVYFDKLW